MIARVAAVAAGVLAACAMLACGSRPVSAPPPVLPGEGPAPASDDATAPTAAAPRTLGAGEALPPLGAPIRWRPLAADRPFLATRVIGSYELRCALSRDGDVACWGRLDPSEDALTTDRVGVATPVLVDGLRGATDLALTASTLCVAQRTGPGACYRLGARAEPAPQFPKPPAQLVALVYDVCARHRDGTAGCLRPGGYVPIAGIAGATDLACADLRCCATTPDGARCFTRDERAARPMPPPPPRRPSPDDCTVTPDGGVLCAGHNPNGQLGDGAPIIIPEPRRVGALDDIVELHVAHNTTCAMRRGGTLSCWGHAPLVETSRYAPKGPLAAAQYVAGCRIGATSIYCHVPTLGASWDVQQFDLPPSRTITSVSIDRDSSICALDTAGAIACRFGMAENGVDLRWTPVPVPPPARAVELQPLATGFCARLADGRVACFLDERYEADPDFLEKLPTAKLAVVPGLTDAAQLATGPHDACVLTRRAEVWCKHVERGAAFEVPSLRGATWIAGNDRHRCAVVRGEVWCWGESGMAQLGDGALRGVLDRVTPPVRAKTPFTAVRVGVGREHTCALDDRGRVWCWGGDRYGQLGQGRVIRAEEPRRVVGLGPRPTAGAP